MKIDTIRKPIIFDGYGVHNAKQASIIIEPNEALNGIYFTINGEMGEVIVPARFDTVRTGDRRTVLQAGHYFVHTPEHLLSALYALGVGSAHIKMRGYEVPCFDGSAKEFATRICQTGLMNTRHQWREINIDRSINVYTHGEAWAKIQPDSNFIVNAFLEYEPPVRIGNQHYSYYHSEQNYMNEICWARTYASREEIEEMRSKGMSLGSDTSNCIIYTDKTGDYEENPWPVKDINNRWKTEFARHKILDFLGDIALLGAQIKGHFTLHRPGHALSHEIARQLAQWYL